MIQIVLSELDFDYELQALVCSFFPECKCQLRVSAEDVAAFREGKILKDSEHPGGLCVWIFLGRREISAWVSACGHIEKQGVDGFDSSRDWHKREGKQRHPYRTEYKNRLKRLVFLALKEFPADYLPAGVTRNIPEWGTMTGVRPTKIAMDGLLQGDDAQAVRTMLGREYCCSPSKAELCLQVAQREVEILQKAHYRECYSLYVGIPFCPTTCLYCSFPSYPQEKFAHLIDAYLRALEREIVATASIYPDRQLSSVYIGGGTPTSLEAGQLERLLLSLRKHFPIGDGCEFTVEAGRPDSITKSKLDTLRCCGVGRISVNPQTMRQETLERIGRNHTVEQTKQAFWMAREAGFQNINMDVIIGLPGETQRDVEYTLSQIAELSPDSLTVHSLVVKRGSKLRVLLEEAGKREQGGAGACKMKQLLHLVQVFAKEQGYHPYYMYRQKNAAGHAGSSGQENIGFARHGKESLYNVLIMEEMQTILAVGAGASTKYYHDDSGIVSRVENVKSVTDYIDRIEEMIARKGEAFRLG